MVECATTPWKKLHGDEMLAGVNLELTEDQRFFRETTRRFIENEAPISLVRGWHDSDQGFEISWWRQAAELGWTSMFAPERAGGGSLSGRPLADAAIVAEEMGRLTTPGPFLPVNVVAAALSFDGADGHADTLAALVSGESVAAWAFGEPGSRWDPGTFATTADFEGTEIVIRGVKSYVEAASAAAHLLVTARSGDGLTQVLVPADSAGVTVVSTPSLDLAKRFGQVRFDGVRLPRSAVVGEIGTAAEAVERQFQIALALQCAETIGGLDRVFEFTLEYMGERYAFGRPISSYQALKHRVADLLLMIESAKGCVDASITSFDEGSPDAAIDARVAKAYVGAKALHIIPECMQLHGGISVTWEHDIHLYLRRATVNRAVFGTPEQHRERICSILLAEEVAGVPG
jgi:alkylation response protein AidB-like acyl-CoA dehydrogenase